MSESLQKPWDELARAASASEQAGQAELPRELLCLSVDGVRYAAPVERVREIVRMRPVTSVPRVPKEVIGVISLRGQVVQVVDLRLRLGVPALAPTRTHRIVVLHGDESEISGLLVDSVHEVLRVTEDAIQPPATGDSEFVNALCAHEDEFVGLLNIEKVLDLGIA